METDCSYYFLSDTAVRVWQTNDTWGQNKMFTCLTIHYKASWFRRVIFKTKKIQYYRLEEMAEEAFLTTWEMFSNKGIAGTLHIVNVEYPWYLFRAFKFNYLILLENELKQGEAEETFGNEQTRNEEPEENGNDGIFFSPRTQQVFSRLTEDCRQLLTWKHIDKISHDEIAARKNINRISSIKMVSRCGKNFLKIWNGNKQ